MSCTTTLAAHPCAVRFNSDAKVPPSVTEGGMVLVILIRPDVASLQRTPGAGAGAGSGAGARLDRGCCCCCCCDAHPAQKRADAQQMEKSRPNLVALNIAVFMT